MLEQLTKVQKERSNAILRAVLTERSITRRRLCSILGLGPSSIVKYIKTLMDLGFLREAGSEDSALGRKRDYLELDDRIGVNIGLVLDANRIEGALVSPSGFLDSNLSLPARRGMARTELLDLLFKAAESLQGAAVAKGRRVWGMGVALGGLVDPARGVSREYLYSHDWYDVPLAALLSARFGLPVSLIKDSHASSLGELYYGRCRGMRDFISLWLGEGIGLGLVLNGELCAGALSNSGEMGHSRLDGALELCYCGRRGCLETEANSAYLLRAGREGLSRGVKSRMSLACGGDPAALTVAMIIEAANTEDRFAMDLFSGIAERVGRRLAEAINLLDPEAVALGGELAESNPFLERALEAVLATSCLRRPGGGAFLVPGPGGGQMRLKGLGADILRRFFR